MENPPLVKNLAYDSLLADTKLIAEAWDAGGLYQVGSFPAFRRWSEWNGRYRDDVREYLKGGLWAAGAALQRIAGSPDIYDTRIRGKHASVNFLTCMMDLPCMIFIRITRSIMRLMDGEILMEVTITGAGTVGQRGTLIR